jgi:MtN3 and saliva related transmembrane protein
VTSELIGWLSSGVLLLTLMAQVRRQWRTDSVEGVSWLLFAGQIAASVGFVTYSILVQNVVFIVTNSLILATAITGQWIYLRKSRSTSRAAAPDEHPAQ